MRIRPLHLLMQSDEGRRREKRPCGTAGKVFALLGGVFISGAFLLSSPSAHTLCYCSEVTEVGGGGTVPSSCLQQLESTWHGGGGKSSRETPPSFRGVYGTCEQYTIKQSKRRKFYTTWTRAPGQTVLSILPYLLHCTQ